MNKLTQHFVAIILCLLTNFAARAQTTYQPKDPKLYQQILHMDSLMFNAFNSHDAGAMGKVFAPNLEFYNDIKGMTDYNATLNYFRIMFDNNKTSGLHRDLVKSTMEVYAIPGYGAIEMGTHTFSRTQDGKTTSSNTKFMITWQLKDNEWRAARVVNWGH